ncbi:hypothetical protein CFC21_062975 [Triticum aestivum]|uniref:Uncharacterized protein n=2 Tax=Triticum aestivum TaxID=4565 RepID=A0A9R1GX88_WHEAT|nr:hypothetical protein CFC21_062120 [Triticum aestivum]KAF7055452.1 hypothetical protein CFC21_062975 [Triticum aestivum]
MVDIENPPAPSTGPAGDVAAGDDAAMAEPSRQGFWSWVERFFAIRRLPDHHPDAGDEVAEVEPNQCSRCIFVHCGILVVLVIAVVSVLLLVLIRRPSHSTAGSVVYFATRVLGFLGMVFSACRGAFFVYLGGALVEGDKEAERTIDRLM